MSVVHIADDIAETAVLMLLPLPPVVRAACVSQVGVFRRGKYAAGKRIGKGNAVDVVSARRQSESGLLKGCWCGLGLVLLVDGM
jgi:hypothetical protein